MQKRKEIRKRSTLQYGVIHFHIPPIHATQVNKIQYNKKKNNNNPAVQSLKQVITPMTCKSVHSLTKIKIKKKKLYDMKWQFTNKANKILW